MRVILERFLYMICKRELGVIVYYSSLEKIIIFHSKSNSIANHLIINSP